MNFFQHGHNFYEAAAHFQDIDIVFQDGTIKTNKVTMAAMSTFLSGLLEGGDKIILDHYTKQDFSTLLHIVEAGNCQATLGGIEALKCLSNTLRLQKFQVIIADVTTPFHTDSEISYTPRKSMRENRDIPVDTILLKTVSKENLGKHGLLVSFQDNLRRSGSDLKICYVCRAVLRGHHVFLGHLRQHTADFGPYACPREQCQSISETGLKLHAHFIQHFKPSIEGKKVCHRCSICGEEFKSFTRLKKHTMSVHNMKPLECPKCGQRFGDKLGLDVHTQAKHNNNLKHPCDVRGKLFSTVRFLQFHRREQHELGDARRLKCEICESACLGKANLLKHVNLMHKSTRKLKCTVCQLNFKKLYNLKVHMRTHTNEAPYLCTTCKLTFKRAHHLKSHQVRCQSLLLKKNSKEEGDLETIEFTIVEDTGHLTLLDDETESEQQDV